MEIEGQKQELAEVEEQELGEEETTLLVRKSRTENEVNTDETDESDDEVRNSRTENEVNTDESDDEVRNSRTGNEVNTVESDDEVSNGVSQNNGHSKTESLVTESRAKDEASLIEQKIKELAQNESESQNGEKKSVNLSFYEGEMEKDVQNQEQEPEELETTLLVRKSRNGIEIETVETQNNGHSKTESLVTENGAKTEDSILGVEQKIKELAGVLENVSEPKNGVQESKKIVFYDGDEGVESASVFSAEEQAEKDPGHNKLDISSQYFIDKDNSTAINNRNGGHLEDNGLFGPKLQSSQSSYQEESTKYKSSNEIESADVDLINEDDLEATEFDVEKVLKEQNTHDLYCPNCNSCITKRVILRKRKRGLRISIAEVKRNKIEAAIDTKLGIGSVQASGDEVGLSETQIPIAEDDERERGPDIFRCLSCFSFFIPTGNGFKLFRGFGGKRVKENVGDEQVQNIKKNWFGFRFTSNRQETAVEKGSSSRTDERTSDIGVASSSNLSDQSVQPSLVQKAPAAHTSEGVIGTAQNGTVEGRDEILRLPRQEPSLNGKIIIGAGEKLDKTVEKIDAAMEQFDEYTSYQSTESKSSTEVHVNYDNNLSATAPTKGTRTESSEDATLFSQGGLKLPFYKGSHAPENSEEWEIFEGGTGSIYRNKDKEAGQLLPPSASVLTGPENEGKLNISVAIPHQEQHVGATVVTEYVENKTTNFANSKSGQVYSTEVSQHTTTTSKYEVHTGEALVFDSISSVEGVSVVQGKDTVITIDARAPGSSQTPQGIIIPKESTVPGSLTGTLIIGDRERTQVRRETEIEVIKSIVYGGLAESITSLSVVSSAAGGDAATLNIVALGMANLVGGLFIICHNLWELRSNGADSASSQVSNQINEPRDRYKELLGRRQNFILHAVVSIISYIIFGLLPPVVYGFSFRKSDDKEFKLLVVAAVSLLCIMMLAIGRAYVQRPPKRYLKTVLNFVILGIMVSGVSYAAGILVERLLENLGLFQTNPASNLVLLSETVGKDSTWGSI